MASKDTGWFAALTSLASLWMLFTESGTSGTPGVYKLSQYCAMKDFGVVVPPHVCLLQRLRGKLPATGY